MVWIDNHANLGAAFTYARVAEDKRSPTSRDIDDIVSVRFDIVVENVSGGNVVVVTRTAVDYAQRVKTISPPRGSNSQPSDSALASNDKSLTLYPIELGGLYTGLT